VDHRLLSFDTALSIVLSEIIENDFLDPPFYCPLRRSHAEIQALISRQKRNTRTRDCDLALGTVKRFTPSEQETGIKVRLLTPNDAEG